VYVRQLELLLAVLSSPTMTQAAERVHLSPAAVSLQLQGLASELNTELFVRSGKKLVPTPAALRLAEHARAVVGRMKEIREEFVNDPAKDARPFHFATGATTLIYRLGAPLRLLRRQFPQIELHVTVAATEEMISGIRDGRFDLALISLPVIHKNLKIIPLFDEELLVVRLAKDGDRPQLVSSIEAAELNGEPFLLYPKQSNMRTLIDRFFVELHIVPRVIMEASDTEAIKRLVESGFGYSILPEYALKESNKRFQLFRVPGHKLVRRQALAMAETHHSRALTESVASLLRKSLSKT